MSQGRHARDAVGRLIIIGTGLDSALVTILSTGKRSYRVVFADLAGVIGAAVAIAGSATATVRITKVLFTQPSVAQTPMRMRKYSTAETGGASTTPTPVPLDSADAAASSVVRLYTVAPTLGTLVGALFDGNIQTGDNLFETFGGSDSQNTEGVVLRGTAEVLAIELTSNASINGYIEWTEE